MQGALPLTACLEPFEHVKETDGGVPHLAVAEVEELTDDAVAVTFEVPDDLADEFAFVPGQSLTLRRIVEGREERRQYSISVPPAPARGSACVRSGRAVLPLAGPRRAARRHGRGADAERRFCPDPAMLEGGRHLCIAAGSGITPMLSVASTVLGRGGDVTLLYGNRTTGSVMFAEELADLKNRSAPTLQLVHVLSREPRDVELFSGRLDADRLRRCSRCSPPRRRSTTCGSAGRTPCSTTRGPCSPTSTCPADRVHVELFYVDAPPPELHRADAEVTGETTEVTVVLDGLSTTGPLPRGVPILDGAQATGPTCRSPARAASAAPAARRSPRARSTCAATTRSSRPRSRPASC